MHEGCWISPTGHWCWVTEHASWIQKPENARLLGLPKGVQAQLSEIPWDFNGSGRVAILLVAMKSGPIRMRGHGASVTFEFILPTATAIQSVRIFMAQNFGPMTWVQFNDLEKGQSFGCFYKDLSEAMDKETLIDLLAEAEDSAREDLSLDTRISQEEGEL